MDGNFKYIEMLFEQVADLESQLEFVKEQLREYDGVEEMREVFDALYEEEFTITVELSRTTDKLEMAIKDLDNIFAKNRFSKEYAKLYKVVI